MTRSKGFVLRTFGLELATNVVKEIIKKIYAAAAAAAAKSLQSCPTLCDPTDGSPPGSPVPEILQARTLEWVAITQYIDSLDFKNTIQKKNSVLLHCFLNFLYFHPKLDILAIFYSIKVSVFFSLLFFYIRENNLSATLTHS